MAANGAKHGGPPKADNKGIKDEVIVKVAGVVIGVGIAWTLFKSVTGRGKERQHVYTQQHVITKEAEAKGKGLTINVEHAGKDIVETLEGAGRAIKGTLIEAGREVKNVLDGNKKEIEHGAGRTGKEVEHRTKEVAHIAKHNERDLIGVLEAAGRGLSHFGQKETQKAKLNGNAQSNVGYKSYEAKEVQVHKGDTLWGIAQKYGVTVEILRAANGIVSGHNLHVGDIIVVPIIRR